MNETSVGGCGRKQDESFYSFPLSLFLSPSHPLNIHEYFFFTVGLLFIKIKYFQKCHLFLGIHPLHLHLRVLKNICLL